MRLAPFVGPVNPRVGEFSLEATTGIEPVQTALQGASADESEE
jgi:hypothetical protein